MDLKVADAPNNGPDGRSTDGNMDHKVADTPNNGPDGSIHNGNMDLKVADAPNNGPDGRSTIGNLDRKSLMRQKMGLTPPTSTQSRCAVRERAAEDRKRRADD